MAEQTLTGWAGIINGAGQLSEVLSSSGMAQACMSNRGDRAECRLVAVKITVDLDPPAPEPPAKKGLFGRRRKK